MIYDVVVIGAGPAGISASLYTIRANKKTLVLYQDMSSLQEAASIQNYYGLEKKITGENLYNQGIKQAKNLGVELKNQEVLKIELQDQNFAVHTNKGKYYSKSVIIAIGNKKNKLNIKGIKQLEGKGVSYCAICDGFFFKGKDVAVIGNGNYAISEANDLINLVKKLVILTNGKLAPEFRGDNVEVITKEIKEVSGENKVEQVVFNDNSSIKTDGIFVAQGVAGGLELAKKIGLIMNKDKIIVNDKMETNIKGIYACGDCTGGLFQISKAVYEGTKAGLEVIKFLNKKEEN